jgi:hypothetical protein
MVGGGISTEPLSTLTASHGFQSITVAGHANLLVVLQRYIVHGCVEILYSPPPFEVLLHHPFAGQGTLLILFLSMVLEIYSLLPLVHRVLSCEKNFTIHYKGNT